MPHAIVPGPLTPNKVRRALAKLGQTPDQIAKSLKTLGIVGTICEPTTCPLAIYLGQVLPPRGNTGQGYWQVGGDWIEGIDRESLELVVELETSPALQVFIDRFDKGQYPDLVAK